MSVFDEIQEALREKADLNARLSLISYEGTPEIKEVNSQKYLYTRKRIGSRVTSTYVGSYSEELYQLLLPPDRKQQSSNVADSVESSVIIDSTVDVIPAEPIITTPAQQQSEDDTPYGTGAIMPNVIGVRYDTVVSQIGKNFKIRADYFYSDATEKGIITEQSIPADTEYDPDRKNELVLKVCKGTENVAVPDYTGKRYTDYSALLDSLDIKYKKVDVFSDYVAIGYVVSTDIGVGYNVNVKNGEVLTVRVSKGKTVKTTAKKDEKEEKETKAE